MDQQISLEEAYNHMEFRALRAETNMLLTKQRLHQARANLSTLQEALLWLDEQDPDMSFRLQSNFGFDTRLIVTS